MKKLSFLLVLAFIASFMFIACDTTGDSTTLSWTRADGDTATLSTIKWVSGGSTDQTWSGSYRTGDSTDSRSVTQLTGNGEAVGSDGQSYELILNQSGSVTLTENSSNSLTISQLSSK